MSLYNMLFGVNPLSKIILATLRLTIEDVGRFRDCFVTNGEIAVYTRNGGGNREHYFYGDGEDPGPGDHCKCTGCIITYHLPKHPCYLRDKDDDFDCTYATIYFKFPDEYADGLKKIDAGEKFDPDARWEAILEALRKSTPPEHR